MHEKPYTNNYVVAAKEKHDRDVEVLTKFFTTLKTDVDRWRYIEEYFIGKDVLKMFNSSRSQNSTRFRSLMSEVNNEKSYSTSDYGSWNELLDLLSEDYKASIISLINSSIVKPEFLDTVFKKGSVAADNIALFSWPSKNVVVFSENTPVSVVQQCRDFGWLAYTIFDINVAELKNALGE